MDGVARAEVADPWADRALVHVRVDGSRDDADSYSSGRKRSDAVSISSQHCTSVTWIALANYGRSHFTHDDADNEDGRFVDTMHQ